MGRRRELKMKDVGIEYLEQYNQLLRYVFQVTDKDLQDIGWEEKEMIRAKSPTLEQADVKGWFDGDKLISQVAVYPMKVRIFNKTYDKIQALRGLLEMKEPDKECSAYFDEIIDGHSNIKELVKKII